MLTIIRRPEDLPFSSLMDVYEQSNRNHGASKYPHRDVNEQLALAEQDLYGYLYESLERKTAICALWSSQGRCVAALRLEQYRDGFLLTSLETRSIDRKKGYGTELVRAVLTSFKERKIYSHIHISNHTSRTLHEKCGFRKIASFAEFLDGSVTNHAYTYLYEMEQPAR